MSSAESDYDNVFRIPEDKSRHSTLVVRRSPHHHKNPSVVLVHGGNTGSSTFNYSRGDLASFLTAEGFNVWLIDWRGSPEIVNPIVNDTQPVDIASERRAFSLDTTADDELPRALGFIRDQIHGNHLAVVSHCLSGAATAMAIARGRLEGAQVDAFVLLTTGLFFRSCWDGWIKAEDYLLEKILHTDPDTRDISPHRRRAWPELIRQAYDNWPRSWLPAPAPNGDDPLEELTYMFGQPYERGILNSWLRRNRRPNGSARSALSAMFGPMHLGLFLHVGQMVRRGHAAPFDAPQRSVGDLLPEHFRGKRITLLTGAENRLWHRDAIDVMYEWLCSNAGGPGHRFTKHVLPGYGHQELLWGARADTDVFELIRDGVALD